GTRLRRRDTGGHVRAAGFSEDLWSGKREALLGNLAVRNNISNDCSATVLYLRLRLSLQMEPNFRPVMPNPIGAQQHDQVTHLQKRQATLATQYCTEWSTVEKGRTGMSDPHTTEIRGRGRPRPHKLFFFFFGFRRGFALGLGLGLGFFHGLL